MCCANARFGRFLPGLRPLYVYGISNQAETRCDARSPSRCLRVLHVSTGARFSAAQTLSERLVRAFSLGAMPVALVGQRGRGGSGKAPYAVTTLHPHGWS